MRRHYLRNILLLPLLVLMACSSIQTFPSTWPKLVPALSGGCLAIVGTFSALDSSEAKTEAVQILNGYNRAPAQSSDHFVVMEPSHGMLEIIVYSGDNIVAKFHYSKQENTLQLTSSEVVAIVSDGLLAAQGVLGFSKISVSFYRDADGYLVMKRNESSVGAYAIIPIVGKSERWYRFQPIKPNTP
jgi:hypothetical protein